MSRSWGYRTDKQILDWMRIDEYLEPVLASLSKDDEEYFRDNEKPPFC